MSDKQLSIMVAEECGWTNVVQARLGYIGQRAGEWGTVPDYSSDLNAMHWAEETLTPEQRDMFYCYLMELLPADENHGPANPNEYGSLDIMLPSSFTMVHAGPRERAIAFLMARGRLDLEAGRAMKK